MARRRDALHLRPCGPKRVSRELCRASLTGAALLLVAASGAHATDDRQAFVLAASCAACHGPDGRSPDSIPTIQGKSASYIADKLTGFKSGEGSPTVMDRLAKGYSDEEIDQIAAWFASRDR